jgi:hypothetical protein
MTKRAKIHPNKKINILFRSTVNVIENVPILAQLKKQYENNNTLRIKKKPN